MIASAKLSGAEFDALPYKEGRKWELIDGALIEKPSPTLSHQLVVVATLVSIHSYLKENRIGGVCMDLEFALNEHTRVRADVAVIIHDRWRNLDQDKTPIPSAPNIAAEVISDSEYTQDSTRKVLTYLRHGVQEMWQLFPVDHTVLIYRADSPLGILQKSEVLQSELLPGWSIPVPRS